jgi:hypothetical protein
MRSWAAILGSADSPAIRALAPQATVLGDVALVTCFEALGRAYAVATNIFVREGNRWKLVHHQAGPTSERPPVTDSAETARPVH